MICDLAETYQITDYESLPPKTVAILVAGLREDSRIGMKKNGVKTSQHNLLLAAICDRLDLIFCRITGNKVPDSVLENFVETDRLEKGKETDQAVQGYDTPEEFIAARYGVE